METVLKSCISSASYGFAATSGTAIPNKECSDSSPSSCRTPMFSSLNHHSSPFQRCPPSSSCPPSPSPSSLPYFPSPSLLPSLLPSPPDGGHDSLPPSLPPFPSGSSSSVHTITSTSSSIPCQSLRLNPWTVPCAGGSGVRWIRPLGYAERFMTLAGRWGNMSTVYALWLDAEGPVSFEAVKYSTQMMFRKMQHLRLCIGSHKNDKWWREMDSDRLDIEEIETDNVIKIFQSLLQRRYNTEEGPLWFVRFIKSVNGNDQVRDANFNLKHKYVCIFGFHHNISDGTTNMNFCNIFLTLLNDVLQNKPIDVKEVGRFAYPIHDELANSLSSNLYLLSVFGARVYKGLIAYCEYVRNFLRHYPMPNDQEGCTLVLENEFDEVTTQRLLKRCKMEKVTLNSAFTAAANIGMFRMILQRDGSVDETRFDSQQAVNMRRYWPKNKQSEAYGCHISMVDIQVPTKKDDITNFWEYTRRIHKIMYNELNVQKRNIKMQPLSEKLWLAVFVNSWMSKLQLPSANDSHYCITNMGDISSTLNGKYPVVSASKILRSVSCHFMQALCQHTLQTYRGKFYYSLDYYPQKIAVGTARTYASSLMDTLRRSIHMPN